MARCPRCGRATDHLVNRVRAVELFLVEVGGDGELSYRYLDSELEGEEVYCCPHCGEELFTGAEEARRFLLGG